MTGITVSQVDGEVVAVKRATEPEHRAQLRHEAETLRRLQHPSVPRLVAFHEGPPAELHTAFVGPDTWATVTPTIEAFAALAAIVADLHDAGLSHGSLEPAHVLVDHTAGPVLCGFGTAAPASDTTIAHDRASLAAMLRDHAGTAPSPEAARLHDAAAALDQPALPLRAAVRVLDEEPPGRSPRRAPGRNRRLAVMAAASIALAVLGIAAIALVGPSAGEPTTTDGATEVAAATMPPPTQPPPPSTTTAPPAPTETPIDATTIDHDGRRYALGSIGDIIAVGDWTCTGEPTPAVLRPATGEVAVFTTWPARGDSLSPAVTTTVVDAIDFVASDQPCPELRVRTPDGSRLIGVPTS